MQSGCPRFCEQALAAQLHAAHCPGKHAWRTGVPHSQRHACCMVPGMEAKHIGKMHAQLTTYASPEAAPCQGRALRSGAQPWRSALGGVRGRSGAPQCGWWRQRAAWGPGFSAGHCWRAWTRSAGGPWPGWPSAARLRGCPPACPSCAGSGIWELGLWVHTGRLMRGSRERQGAGSLCWQPWCAGSSQDVVPQLVVPSSASRCTKCLCSRLQGSPVQGHGGTVLPAVSTARCLRRGVLVILCTVHELGHVLGGALLCCSSHGSPAFPGTLDPISHLHPPASNLRGKAGWPR